MGCHMTPKSYSAWATVILGMFAVYGVIGSIFYYKDLSKFPDKGDWPFNQRFTIYIIMAVNSLYALSAGLGLFALSTQRTDIFLWCAFILLGTFAVQLLHGVACLRASMEPMDAMIFSTFRKYGKGIEYQEWLLDFQWQYDCCGVKSYMDWRLFDKSVDKESVPDSCCSRWERVPNQGCGKGLIAPNVSVHDAKKVLNIIGCGEKISSSYQDEIRIKGVIMLIVAFTALAIGVALFILKQKVRTGTEVRQVPNATKRTETDVGRQSQRNSSHRNSDAPSDPSSPASGVDTHRIPSYYKTAVAHKPPTGRSRVPRQDSTRNFGARALAQRNGAKHRMNPHHHNRTKYNYNNAYGSQGRTTSGKSQKGQNDMMKTKLEMLMHPIETHSTSSATPNPSDMFPFYGDQASSSACVLSSKDCDKRAAGRVKNPDRKITHYNSLPQVVTFPSGRIETQHHYNTSHVHAQSTRRKHSQRAPPPTFVEGKYPSLTMTSTLATIHEENESVRSGNSQASSTCTTTSSSSPKSLSKSPSKHVRTLDSEAVYRQLNLSSDQSLEEHDGQKQKEPVVIQIDNENANENIPVETNSHDAETKAARTEGDVVSAELTQCNKAHDFDHNEQNFIQNPS